MYGSYTCRDIVIDIISSPVLFVRDIYSKRRKRKRVQKEQLAIYACWKPLDSQSFYTLLLSLLVCA